MDIDPDPTRLDVVAGILWRPTGEILLAQRLPGKHLGGMWEFPGGKLEPGEDAEAALGRELDEELGVVVGVSVHLTTVFWDYAGQHIRLRVRKVLRWDGEPHSCEGQALRWQLPRAIEPAELAPADRQVLTRLMRGLDEQ